MFICPACNGFEVLSFSCPECEGEMTDRGRLVDYLDEYSPYLDDEGLKLVDGLKHSTDEHTCLHVLYCSQCETTSEYAIQEEQQ